MNFSMGDPVLFRDDKRKEWKRGTALVKYGKTLYLKYGNFLRRVPVDTVIHDIIGEEAKEEQFIEPLEEQENADRFLREETPVVEMEKDLEAAQENIDLKKKLTALEDELSKMKMKCENVDKEPIEENIGCEKFTDTDVDEKKKLRRDRQKVKKMQQRKIYPKLGQIILFKEKNCEKWVKAKVFGVFKKNSKFKSFKQLELEDGRQIEKDFDQDIEAWKPLVAVEDSPDDNVINEENECFPIQQVLKKSEYSNPEVKEAMLAEIDKFRKFDAVEEVEDNGQHRIPIRWVVTRNEIDGKNQPLKARLCVRGDLEQDKELVRSDSPTAGKESLKLALIIAANEGFSVKSADVKSAYLQGLDMNRSVYVQPPDEAGVKQGFIWRLKKASYGILDGGRRFYLRLVDELEKLGLHKIHADGAIFSFVQSGKLHGLVVSHVDDFLLIGDQVFHNKVELKLQEIFKFSKIESGTFKYCGCTIRVKDNSVIELDQQSYIDGFKTLEIKEKHDRPISSEELKLLRGKIGEILWVSLMTRPDLAFEVNQLSSEVPTATIQTLKKCNALILKAKKKNEVMRFVKLGPLSDLAVKLYTDASYQNQEDRVKSTEGRIVLIENTKTGSVNTASWKTRKIPRVCRSVKSAETRALEDGIDDAVHTARLLHEIYTGNIDLKNPGQTPVHALTDSKSLWESIHNTKQCEEKLLRNSIASIKEMVGMGMISSVDWVPTDLQLADCLTKSGLSSKSEWLLSVARSNKLHGSLD